MPSDDYKKKIIYQIYPSSFKDSNNDGWGDLQGIISKLDYLQELGIGIIWLSPIYESPMDDMGYDISDYKAINHRFGTMADFDELINEARKRDIRIVMDLVINHTSTSHYWFQEAIKDTPDNKYRDYYYIKPDKENGKPFNNWQASFSGSAWKGIDALPGYSYLHLYCDTQADLNYHNELVIQEIEDIMIFWLNKGVYGFRCDVINNIYKSSLKDDHSISFFGKGTKYYSNQDGCYAILKRIREEVLDKYDAFLVGETGNLTKATGNRFLQERCLDMFFEFDHVWCDKYPLVPIIKRKFSVKKLVAPIFRWQNDVDWIGVYLENHDQLRSISRDGDENKYRNESAKLLALFLLTLKGTPFIYQGEEIGMSDNHSLTLDKTNDICSHMAFKTAKGLLPLKDKTIEKMINETVNRDHAREPMQWDDSPNAGFNTGKEPWCLMNPNFPEINVKKQSEDQASILSFYKRMIKFRNSSPILQQGSFKAEIISSKINSYFRCLNGETYLIILNFSAKTAKYKTALDLTLKLSNYEITLDFNALPPYFAGIFKVA
ncbi:MAG: alpha-glucosidase [Bacilli bacterium]